jgi:hypothetical protein
MVNLISMDPGVKVTEDIHLDSFEEGYHTMNTNLGVIKRTELRSSQMCAVSLRAMPLTMGTTCLKSN